MTVDHLRHLHQTTDSRGNKVHTRQVAPLRYTTHVCMCLQWDGVNRMASCSVMNIQPLAGVCNWIRVVTVVMHDVKPRASQYFSEAI